ncbi:hypothetical protein CPB83DRAFT_848107 [Crepidotus variabilis]|uniref:PHD-type domain-containing protein n=1 Tax=Crepidotus variabilis TaxID=179855 RepID=A0A9P6JT48_9AGAR|nr:hypothetical protein CPB83DRAFT_848107 [Crepidotus variabilis]
MPINYSHVAIVSVSLSPSRMASRRLDISSLLCNDEPQVSPLEALVQAATEERKRLHEPHDEPRYLPQPQPQPQQRSREDYLVYDRRRQQQEDRQLELLRLQEQERRAQQEILEQQQQQQQILLLQRRRREEEHHRALEYERQAERDRMEAQRRQVLEERQRRDAAERELERQRFLQQQQQQQQRERAQYRFPPSPVAAHPSSISHLISHSPPIRHSNPSISSLDDFDRLDGDDRPVKKRRYSNSPTRHEDYQQQHQQQERLARERERMRVGELGYGRIAEPLSQLPIAGPSSSLTPATSSGPRRPGSGHSAPRKVAVADLLVDREPSQPLAVIPPPDSREGDARRIISPVGGNRRSPPGSQAGRAKAARKSDEYIASLQQQTIPILPNEDPVKPSRSRQLSDEARTSSGDDQPRPQQLQPPVAPPRQRKTQAQTLVHSHPPATVHPSLLPLPPSSSSGSSSSPVTTTTTTTTTGPFAPKLSTSTSSASAAIPSAASRSRQGGQAQQDPHEWFLHQYDEEPSPTAAVKPPPHTPSPSLSPTAGILVPGVVPSSTMGMSAAAMGALGISATNNVPHVPHSQAKSKGKSQSKSKSPPVASSHPPHSHNKIFGGPATSTVTAADSLDKELEDLVSESKPSTPIAPTTSIIPSASTTNKPVKPPKQTKPRKPKKQPKEEVKDDMDLALDQAMNELVEEMEEDQHHDVNIKRELGVDTSMGMEVDVEDELLSLVDDRPPPPLPPPHSTPSASSQPHPPPPSLTVPPSTGSRRLSGSLAPATSHGSLTPTQPAQGVTPTRLSPIPPPQQQQQHKRSISEAPQVRSSPTIPSPIISALGPSTLSTSGKPSSASAAMSVARSTSDRESMPPPVSTSSITAAKTDHAGSVVTPEPGSANTSAVSATTTSQQTGTKKKKESAVKGTGAKAKAAAAKAEKAEKEKAEKEKAEKDGTTAAKPKGKGGARSKKDKAAAAAAESLAASINAAVASGSTPPAPPPAKPAKGGRKASGTAASASAAAVSASRSRSTSVMRGTTPAQDSDAGKVDEKDKEGGAEEDEEPEDDNKLYCLCKTKYDEGRFMIACDRCDEWYHTQCVNMPDLEVDLVDQFICPSCVEKNPHLNLQTTYKTRCLFGLKHPDPDSPKACHKAARGAFSKYCSEECGVKYMQSRIDTWAKKGGKTEKLWETVKSAEKREGVVVCKIQEELDDEDKDKMDVDEAVNGVEKSIKPTTPKHKVIPPSKPKIAREHERLDLLLASIVSKREEMQRGMELIVCRERLLQLASERAELVGQCGWDQRLCCDDDELGEMGSAVWETYEESEKRREKEDGQGGDQEANGDQEAESMDVDGNEEQWWCPGKKVCDRHSGWQTIRYKEVSKEKEMKEEALAKLTTREREIRKRIEDLLDPQGDNAAADTNGTNGAATTGKDNGGVGAPLKSSNAKLVNGHSKSKATTGEKKGKKRKAPTS